MQKSKLQGKNIPFVQAHHVAGRQRPTSILLKTSFTTGDRGAALGIANAWTNPYNRTASCHYVIDESRVYRCVPDKAQAMPFGTKIKGAITINVCYDPSEGPLDAVFYGTSHLVARLCKLYRIRPRLLSHQEEMRWLSKKWRYRGGIILKTVGDFPADKFLDSVSYELEAL